MWAGAVRQGPVRCGRGRLGSPEARPYARVEQAGRGRLGERQGGVRGMGCVWVGLVGAAW